MGPKSKTTESWDTPHEVLLDGEWVMVGDVISDLRAALDEAKETLAEVAQNRSELVTSCADAVRERDEARAELARRDMEALRPKSGLLERAEKAERERDEARYQCDVLDGWRTCAEEWKVRALKAEVALSESQASVALWKKATGRDDPEALDLELGRAGLDHHFRVLQDLHERASARAKEMEEKRDAALGTIEELHRERDVERKQLAESQASAAAKTANTRSRVDVEDLCDSIRGHLFPMDKEIYRLRYEPGSCVCELLRGAISAAVAEAERERDEARVAANTNKAEYTLAFDRVQNLELALSESQAQVTMWKRVVGRDDPETLDLELGRAGLDHHLRVLQDLYERASAKAQEMENKRDAAIGTIERLRSERDVISAEAHAAQAQCAAMREAAEKLSHSGVHHPYLQCGACVMEAALYPDAGRALLTERDSLLRRIEEQDAASAA
jgi:regulator of replication initiation timing